MVLILPMQSTGKQRLVNGGHLQSLSLLVVSYDQQPFGIHILSQNLRLTMVRHLDAEHQAILET